MHDAFSDVKREMRFDEPYAGLMETPGERLRRTRERAGYETAKDAAEAMGVPVSTYTQHENGDRGLPASRAERYARFFRVAPEWLIYGTTNVDKVTSLGPTLYVIGEVQAGVFKTAWQRDRDDWESFTGRPDLITPIQERFGLRVVGDSMNLLYPEGTILECCYYRGHDVIPSGKRVIVQRTRRDGAIEATVKELQRDEAGDEWLVPRSSNPAHRAFRGDRPDDPEIERVEIIAIVVASIRLE